MCKNVEAVLDNAIVMDPRCEVTMDGVGHVSDDFICILNKENGDASIFFNTDALSMGMAMKMVSKSFVEMMYQLSEEERREISEVLGDAFVFDKPQEDANE